MNRSGILKIIMMMLLLGFGLVLVCREDRILDAGEKNWKIWKESTKPDSPVIPRGYPSFAPLVKTLKPAVVNIYTTQIVKMKRGFRSNPFGGQMIPGPDGYDPFEEFFRQFFGPVPDSEIKRQSLGSGFIINSDGYVMTNNHVVANASEIKVKLENGSEYIAEVLGKDEKYDLALLQIKPGEKLPEVKFGDSDALEVGDWVIAIGNPFGLAHTVTAGIVSAKERVIGAGPYDDFIQTDAAINQGNSGGPLFNANGDVVGINAAILAAGQGIGFAVPINMAKNFIKDIMTKGKVTRGWLGVHIQNLTDEIAESMGVKTSQGALVAQVFAGSPAEKAGIISGDILLEFNGKKVKGGEDITRLVGMTEPGGSFKITLLRNGKEKTVEGVIVERTESETAAKTPEGKLSEGLGMKLAEITPEIAEKMGVKPGKGIFVSDVDISGKSAEAGIRKGDIIIEINRKQVNSIKDFQTVISGIRKSDSILMLVQRNDNYFYTVLKN
jgi:serine protease Do